MCDEPKSLQADRLDPIERLLPGRQVHLLSGSSGAGKTSFLAWLLRAFNEESHLFGHVVTRPPFIGYIGGDRSIEDAEKKFRSAGCTVPCYGVVDDLRTRDELVKMQRGGYDGERNYPIFQLACEYFLRGLPGSPARLPEDSLIVVDAMATVFGIEPAGRYLQNVAAPLALLNQYCLRARYTLLLIHHGGKQMQDKQQRYARSQDRVLGSMGLLGFTSTQLQLTEPELTEHPRWGLHQLTVVGHAAPATVCWFRRNPETGLFAEAFPAQEEEQHFELPHSSTAVARLTEKERLVWETVPSEGTLPLIELQLQLEGRVAKSTLYYLVEKLVKLSLLSKADVDGVLHVRRGAPEGIGPAQPPQEG